MNANDRKIVVDAWGRLKETSFPKEAKRKLLKQMLRPRPDSLTDQQIDSVIDGLPD